MENGVLRLPGDVRLRKTSKKVCAETKDRGQSMLTKTIFRGIDFLQQSAMTKNETCKVNE